MAQNVYDDPQFFAGYRRLARSERGLDGAPEWPDVRAMLPDLAGRDVVDLGCGFGAFARWAAEQGARRVDAYDLSERMLDQARQETGASDVIDYQRADLDELTLPESSYDVAYSALVLHYLADLPRFLSTVQAALREGGTFVLTTEHPLYMAPSRPGFVEVDGRRVWPVDQYGVEGVRVTDWMAPGVRKQYRTLGTTLTALVDAGLSIEKVVEFCPTPAQVEADPDLADEVERPMFVVVQTSR